MITSVWPGWYKVGLRVRGDLDYILKERWCLDNLGSSDHDTWSYSQYHFSFKDEKWALMFLLKFAA